MLGIILLVFAFVLACLATFNVSARWNLIAAALAFYFLSLLLGSIGSHIGFH